MMSMLVFVAIGYMVCGHASRAAGACGIETEWGRAADGCGRGAAKNNSQMECSGGRPDRWGMACSSGSMVRG